MLFKAEDENELALHNALQSMKAAKESKNAAEVHRLKAQIKELQFKKAKIKEEIKEATNKNSIYYRAAKPYLDAQKTIKQMENYQHYGEIIALYAAAKNRIETKDNAYAETAVK